MTGMMRFVPLSDTIVLVVILRMSVAVFFDADCDIRELDHDNIVIAEPLVEVKGFTMSFDKAIVD
jgi:hypothetical protein